MRKILGELILVEETRWLLAWARRDLRAGSKYQEVDKE